MTQDQAVNSLARAHRSFSLWNFIMEARHA